MRIAQCSTPFDESTLQSNFYKSVSHKAGDFCLERKCWIYHFFRDLNKDSNIKTERTDIYT